MHIIGLDTLVFAVADLAEARRYLLDYGLVEAHFDSARGGRFEALDGTGLEVRALGDPSLPPPPPGTQGPGLRETVHGVADAASLAAIQAELARDRALRVDAQGAIHGMDDGGYAVAFQRTVRRPFQAPPLGFNVPGQPPGRAANVCAADEAALIQARTLSHVVYFVADAVRAEAFYARLGFVATDRFRQLGPFLRPKGTQDHHTLFLIQQHNDHMVGCNHFTFHFGSAAEVLQQGWRFAQKGHTSFWGPGRHVLGSNVFWYFKSPFGAEIEFDADMDLHDDSWVPREVDPGADNSQVFLLQAVPKWAPGG